MDWDWEHDYEPDEQDMSPEELASTEPAPARTPAERAQDPSCARCGGDATLLLKNGYRLCAACEAKVREKNGGDLPECECDTLTLPCGNFKPRSGKPTECGGCFHPFAECMEAKRRRAA